MFEDADVVCAYTRADAIADGQQFCLSKAMPEECRMYKYPVYVTSGVWDLVEGVVNNPRAVSDYKGIVWDLMWMSQHSVVSRRPTGVDFKCIMEKPEGVGRGYRSFVMECGPKDFDDPTPVLTLMLPEER